MGDIRPTSVPKPMYHFQRPHGGAGPRLQMNFQASTAANPTPNIPSIPTSTLQSAGITTDQIAAIANIVMAVQNQNTRNPSRNKKMNITGTIKDQKSRVEKNPRRRDLVVRARFLSQHKKIFIVR